jgi:hypothetical protein
MKRAEYERGLHAKVETNAERYTKEANALNVRLQDLEVQVVLCAASIFTYSIQDKDGYILVEGLNPTYANANDYRQFVLALRGKDE